MSNILYQNTTPYSQPYPTLPPFTEAVFLFIKSKGGQQLDFHQNLLTFQYPARIDAFETKSLLLQLEERKNSFKMALSCRLSIEGLFGGLSTLMKMIEGFNSTIQNEWTVYAYNQPDVFAANLRVDKDNFQQFEGMNLRNEILGLLDNTSNNFLTCITKIIYAKHTETINLKRIRDVIDVLNIAKVHMESQIQKRNAEYRPAERQFNFEGFYKPNPQIHEDNRKYASEQELAKLHAVLRKMREEKLRATAAQEVKPLVHKIKMVKDELDENWVAPPSSFGSLTRVIAQFLVLQSFNNATARAFTEEFNIPQKMDKKVLIRKQFSINSQCKRCVHQIQPDCACFKAKQTFMTEVQILLFIRNVITCSVAEFFMQDKKSQTEQVRFLYSKYYQRSLTDEYIASKQIIPFISIIMEGLKTLNNSYVIHRDMKPANVLLDSKRCPKIIDFGSAYELKGAIAASKINQQLITTQKYNLFYEKSLFAEKSKMSKKQFEQHELYDMHALGVILLDLISDSGVTSELGPQLMPNLKWLVAKCCAHNPNVRPNHEEASNFLALLYKLWQAKCSAF